MGRQPARTRVILESNLPAKFPVSWLTVFYLIGEKVDNVFYWSCYLVLAAVITICYVALKATELPTDIFNHKN